MFAGNPCEKFRTENKREKKLRLRVKKKRQEIAGLFMMT